MPLTYSQNRSCVRGLAYLNAAKQLVDGDPTIADVPNSTLAAAGLTVISAAIAAFTALGPTPASANVSLFPEYADTTTRLWALLVGASGEAVTLRNLPGIQAHNIALTAYKREVFNAI